MSGRARAPRRVERRGLPARAPDDRRHRRRGEFFARAGEQRELLELLAWAGGASLAVAVVGSGSNLLIADDGVRGLVAQARPRARARSTVEGGGSAAAAARGCRRWRRARRAPGLSGIEFGVNIPGTVGGAVRMNANAYGGELATVLEWVEIATASGLERRAPEQLGLGYRSSNLVAGEVVAGASLRLEAGRRRGRSRRRSSEMRRRRHEAQPQGIRTFGSTFKNPDDPRAEGRSAGLLLAEAGCNGLAIGGARFAPKHANFIENTGSASTADVLAVMAEGRRRVRERFGVELEPEVQVLGDVRFPWR